MSATHEAAFPANYVAALDAMQKYLEEETDEIWRAKCATMTPDEKLQELATQARMSDDHSLQKAAAKIRKRAAKKLTEAAPSELPQ